MAYRYSYLIILGLWTLYGIGNAILVHYRSMAFGKVIPWTTSFIYEVPYTWLWALVTPLILFVGRWAFRERWNLLWHLPVFVFCTISTKLTWDFLILPLVMPSEIPGDVYGMTRSVLRTLDFSFLHYVVVVCAQIAIDYYRRYEDGRLRAAQLETRLATAQLQALKMQLHPHFLFNTLHSISELVHADPPRAETMIVRLSDFLRLTLDKVGTAEVQLSEEIDFLERYLDIEKMRYEDRLRIEWQVDPATLRAKVPNLILQPIVENALKHGIAKLAANGLLRIRTFGENGQLVLEVSDNGPGPLNGNQFREGLGLNNTRSRLEKLYGGNHMITLRQIPADGFRVTVRIPFEERR